MKLQVKLTVQDYLTAQRLHFRPAFLLRTVLWLLAGFLLAAFAQQIWLIVHHRVLPGWWWLLPLGLGYGGLLFFIFLPWKVGRLFKSNPKLAEPMEVELTSAGLLLETSRGKVRAPWAMLKSWKRNRAMILIYHSRVHFHIFPRRAFSSESEFSAAADLLQKHLGAERI